jgi:hypothetical protein
VTNPEASLAEVIETSLRGDPPPQEWFEDRLKRGQCLVMFDGLDEVADPALRHKIVQWAERQVGLLAQTVSSFPHVPFPAAESPAVSIVATLHSNREQTSS